MERFLEALEVQFCRCQPLGDSHDRVRFGASVDVLTDQPIVCLLSAFFWAHRVDQPATVVTPE